VRYANSFIPARATTPLMRAGSEAGAVLSPRVHGPGSHAACLSEERMALPRSSAICGTIELPRALSFWTRLGTPLAVRPPNRTSRPDTP
jgi:hypothetical protein